MIKSASYSRLIDFEQCPYRAKLKYVERLPEEESPAANRGTAVHQMAEDYVRGQGEMPSELRKFEDEFVVLRHKYKEKQVSLEGEWGFDRDWMPCDYKQAWLRMKADAVYTIAGNEQAVVIDYKTGKRFGNELKHGEQVQLYAIAAFIRNPELKEATVELWYLDCDELHTMRYTRALALRYLQSYDKRFDKMTSATQFPANPNAFSCKFCSYGPNRGGQCEYGTLQVGNAISNYRKKFG